MSGAVMDVDGGRIWRWGTRFQTRRQGSWEHPLAPSLQHSTQIHVTVQRTEHFGRA